MQNTSQVETDLFSKGMIKDMNASFQGNQNWSHARNAINNSVSGDVGVLGNEPANLKCIEICYTIIGTIHLYGDKWVIFSTDDTSSEIGLFDDSQCEYEAIVNDECLNFNKRYLITGAAKENFDCTWQVYWDDGKNASRTLNIDDVPWVQIETSAINADCKTFKDGPCLDCERLRLAPFLDTPCVTIRKADDGGQIRNGSYQAFIAYTVNEEKIGDYIGISNIQSLFDHDDTSGALLIEVSNLDKEFDFYELVIISNNQQEIQAKRIGLYSTEQTKIHLDNIDQKLLTIALDKIPLRNPAYEKTDSMYVVNDWLLRSGPTEQFDFNYQKYANQIKAQWVSALYPGDYYYKGGNKPTFMRDEVYAFFIRFIYNTGERSSSYHIPGRPPSTFTLSSGGKIGEIDTPLGDPNQVDSSDKNFQIYNTAYKTSPLNYYDDVDDDDMGLIDAYGNMAYWQSTEKYPAKQPDIWGDLCGKPIRHHKFPSEVTDPTTNLSEAGGTKMRMLGVKFTNILAPRYEDGTLIKNIVGYEILRGSREGNKSILAKGIIRNMRKYLMADGDQQTEDSITNPVEGLYPNFPFNDLRYDAYHSFAETYGCDNMANSLLKFNPLSEFGNINNGQHYQPYLTGGDGVDSVRPITEEYAPYLGYKKDIFTFHSPDLSFKHPFLNPHELQIYGTTYGFSTGNFIPSEGHPQCKLLRNGAAWIAMIFGVGYALSKIRGKTSRNMTSAVPLDIGLFGTMPGTLSAPFAIPGVGQAISAVDAAVLGAFDVLKSQIIKKVTNTIAFPFDVTGIGDGYGTLMNLTIASNNAFSSAAMAGSTGGGTNYTIEGSEYQSTPGLVKLMHGMFMFMHFMTEGGQTVIDLIYNFVSMRNFAFKHNAHGFYSEFTTVSDTKIFRTKVDESTYLNNSFQNFGRKYKINNLFRPKTVVVDLEKELDDPALTIEDHSRYVLGQIKSEVNPHKNPGLKRRTRISAHYAALKFSFQNQYGQLDGIRQIPMRGCVDLFPKEVSTIDKFSTSVIFGGDCYVNRYTEKIIMPIFWEFLNGQPDMFPFDYRERYNIPFPRYWMNTEKYQLSQMAQAVTRVPGNMIKKIFGVGTGSGKSTFQDAMPRGQYYLDRRFDDCGTDEVPATLEGGTHTNDGGADIETSGSDEDLGNAGAVAGGLTMPDEVGEPGKKRGLFNLKYGYMYTHCNGINDFFVESEINVAQRDWETQQGRMHYDAYNYTQVDSLFHADIIGQGNYYKYDYSLSTSRFWSNLISFGNVQPRNYDPEVAASCWTYYPKRLIYSLQAQLEAKKDFWRVYLPLNYKDFKSKVNVIKPINKSGSLIFFPYLSPQVFEGLDEIKTQNETTLTIGDGQLFGQPFKNIVNSDVSNEYGSCESARSVINTPTGVFFISQAQGKIFQFTGKLENIANLGMKWWFNKYLPSQLLQTFPELEGSVDVDNPVVGVGCQSIYDPNNDIVYFCKKDYAVKEEFKACIDYNPTTGFGINQTCLNGASQVPTCPDGYTLNSNGMCEKISYEPAVQVSIGGGGGSTGMGPPGTGWEPPELGSDGGGFTSGECKADIVLLINMKYCPKSSLSSPCGIFSLDYPKNGNYEDYIDTIGHLRDELVLASGTDNLQISVIYYAEGCYGVNEGVGAGGNTCSNVGGSFSWQTYSYLTDDEANVQCSIVGGMAFGSAGNDAYGKTLPPSSCNIANGLYEAYERLFDPTYGRPDARKYIFMTASSVAMNEPAGIYNSRLGNPATGNPGFDLGPDMFTRDIRRLQVIPTGVTGVGGSPELIYGPGQTNKGATLEYANEIRDLIENPLTGKGVAGGKIFLLTVDGADKDYPIGSNGLYPNHSLHPSLPKIPVEPNYEYYFKKQTVARGMSTTGGVDPQSAYFLEIASQNCYMSLYADDTYKYHLTNGWSSHAAGDSFMQVLCGDQSGGNIGWSIQLVGQMGIGGGSAPITPGVIDPPYTIDPTVTWHCPTGGTLEQTSAGQWVCKLIDLLPPIYIDSIMPIPNGLLNKTYFEDISWTVSYDPKSKAWISFHDWHPELCVPSINHFMTTKTKKIEEGCCPEGYNIIRDQCQKTTITPATQIPTLISELPLQNGEELELCPNPAIGTYGSRSALLYGPGYGADASARTDDDSIPSWASVSMSGLSSPCGGGIPIPTTLGNYGVEKLAEPFWTGQDDGIVNKLAQWICTSWATHTFYGFVTPIEVPETKTYHVLLSADNQFRLSINNNVILTSGDDNEGGCVGVDETWTEHFWQIAQVMGYPQSRYCCFDGSQMPFRHAHIYPVVLDKGCYDIKMEGNDFFSQGMFACAILDMTATEIKDATSFSDLPLETTDVKYIFSSEHLDKIYANSTGFTCPDGSEPTYPDGGCIPSCSKIVYNWGCLPTETCDKELPCELIRIYLEGLEGEIDSRVRYECHCIDRIPPSYEEGSIWRHNVRCDKYANYYDIDYPWEVELVQTTGQEVTTVRSLEYQMEAYVYKNDCADRWHDLNFNFDEVVIYNTEQVSGLLKLNLVQNDPVKMLTYPKIAPTGHIEILYTKEEQKYRLDQFWDITRDRGEFTGVEANIWITKLNGYIKDLNFANLNYQKAATQRKKFRHYYNKAILRRVYSGDKKMLLKLNNTKLNLSFR